ncbi:hypothetical protein ACIQXI_14760 [Lysinibacillus sp. NPDC097195]|uniref:hypothetical protein n=1 Tax=Lysinibacillus sp. NPDC097195 TaxID=3364141 RepID=UPI003814CD99
MRFKFGILVFISLFYLFSMPQHYQASADGKDLALIYVTSNRQVDEEVQILREMLEAYTTVDVIPIENVQENTLADYKRVVLFNGYKMQIPATALQALNKFQGPAVAIGENIEQLAPFAHWHWRKTVELRKIGEHVLERPLEWHVIHPPDDVEMKVMASSFNAEFPFVMKERTSNWSYIGGVIQSSPVLYDWPAILGDLLILPPPTIHPAFIVLTDINMETDVGELKKVVQQLQHYNVPINLQITPLYEEDGGLYYLQNNKALLKYLQQLQQDGVTFILSSSQANIEKSLEILVLRHIYPTLVQGDSTFFNGVLRQKENHFYITKNDSQNIYPYTIAAINEMDVQPLYALQQSIRHIKSAPGSAIGIQYPSYLGAHHVQELVELLTKQLQFEWFDFRKTEQFVKTSKVTIMQSTNGEQKVQLAFTNIDRLKMRFDERPFEMVLWLLVIIVSLFVTVFFMNTLRLRVTLRKRLFEERKHNG